MWKVYVGNLDSRVKEREIADDFRVYGNVRSVWVARNPPGYAFVEFDDRRDAEDAVSRLDGKHGWRVEMSRKSVGGGRGRPSYGSSESKCYDCGGIGHFARECRSRVSKHSRRRSPSPARRSDSHRHGGLARSGRGGSRSPSRYDRRNSFRDRSSPRRKRERSRSLESDKSDSRGHRGKGRKYSSTSPQHEKSDVLSPQKEHEPIKSPQNNTEGNDHEVRISPQNGESDAREALSPQIKRSESSKSLSSERSEDIGGLGALSPQIKRSESSKSLSSERSEHIGGGPGALSPQIKRSESSKSLSSERSEHIGGLGALSPQIKRSESSKSLSSERSEDIGGLRDIKKEGYEHKGTIQGEESDIDRNDRSPVTKEDSRSPQPENNVTFADGDSPLNGGSPVRNGSASISPVEENNGSYPDRSPAEDLAEEEHPNGESD